MTLEAHLLCLLQFFSKYLLLDNVSQYCHHVVLSTWQNLCEMVRFPPLFRRDYYSSCRNIDGFSGLSGHSEWLLQTTHSGKRKEHKSQCIWLGDPLCKGWSTLHETMRAAGLSDLPAEAGQCVYPTATALFTSLLFLLLFVLSMSFSGYYFIPVPLLLTINFKKKSALYFLI